MIFETHAHFEDERYKEDRENLLREIFSAGIERIVNVGSTIETSKTSIALAERYENMFAAIGVHPSDIDCLTEEGYAYLREHASHKKVVAIGEIGLDYYWEKDEAVRLRQQEAFINQLKIAWDVNLPIIVHSRDAAEPTMQILKQMPKRDYPGIIHCYSYSVEHAREYVKMGYFIGVGGVITFKNAKVLKEVVDEIDLDHIVVETDCPYMAPEPHRGERNHSGYLPYIVDKIAQIKGVSAQQVEEVTARNARLVFPKEATWQH